MPDIIAVAPCSWGIENAENSENPPWSTVLEEASGAGYAGVETGPYGYLPGSSDSVDKKLKQEKLKVIAGTLYDNLVSHDNLPSLLAKTEETCRMLSALDEAEKEPFLVIIDSVSDARNNTAGHPERAVRLALPEWKGMMSHITDIAAVADKYGVRPVIHPHAGGYMEFDDETERFLNDIPHETAGLCLDTGHLQYACSDPAGSLKKFASRLDYVHFKDINRTVYEKAVGENMGFFDACLQGVMCSIGKGCVDYRAVKEALDQIGYRGWITIEQERDPKNWRGALADITESRKFLASLGF